MGTGGLVVFVRMVVSIVVFDLVAVLTLWVRFKSDVVAVFSSDVS